MKPRHRHKARRLALQAIYQWQIAKTPLTELEQQFIETQDPHKVDIAYFQKLICGVIQHSDTLDKHIIAFSHRPLSQLNLIELAVLRLATYELQEQLEIPYRVIINEALQLNKTFGTDEGYKYVNGILQHVAEKLRVTEISL